MTTLWLNYLRTNSEAMSSYLEFLAETKSQKLDEMRVYVGKSDIAHAQETEGEIKLLDILRNQVTMSDKEKRAFEEYKTLKKA